MTRHGDWNARNTDLYNECHTNPYREIFIRLRDKRMEEIARREIRKVVLYIASGTILGIILGYILNMIW